MSRSTAIVVGDSPIARQVARALGHPTDAGVVWVQPAQPPACWCEQPAAVRGLPYDPDTLHLARLGPDSLVLALTDDEIVNFIIAVAVQRLAPSARVIAAIDSAERAHTWASLGVQTVDPVQLTALAILRQLTA
ncbi:NAD-binding protein [Myxococcota bacterium]|nr:NAD-binding protein [Myxococcota bacterium]